MTDNMALDNFDALYAKACKTSQPADWMEAALAAQQIRARLREVVAPPVPAGTRFADRGFRWDGERQQHIPQLIVEFDPVPFNSGSDAKGWRDRDAMASMFSQPTEATHTQPAAKPRPQPLTEQTKGEAP